MIIKSIKKIRNLSGKKIFWRADFNVPIKNNKIADDFKIIRQIPTLRYLLRYGAKVIIVSHLQPGKIVREKDTLKPVAQHIGKILAKRIKFIEGKFDMRAESAVAKMRNGSIVFLDNIRFNSGEKENSTNFAKNLAKLADIYVSDAFAVSHRRHASVSAIKRYLPSYAGLLMAEELKNLNKILYADKPLVVVLGGAKISTKLPLIKKFYKKADYILIGGALANNFIAAHGYSIGQSFVEPRGMVFAGKYLNSKEIILPLDVITGSSRGGGRAEMKSVAQVGKDDFIFDIGPQTIKLFDGFIKKASTIIWNGPLGFFELKKFRHGTLSIGKSVAARSRGRAFGVVGGGETIEALKMTKMLNYLDWVSTGGGAMLTYLGGGAMPGLKRIYKN